MPRSKTFREYWIKFVSLDHTFIRVRVCAIGGHLVTLPPPRRNVFIWRIDMLKPSNRMNKFRLCDAINLDVKKSRTLKNKPWTNRYKLLRTCHRPFMKQLTQCCDVSIKSFQHDVNRNLICHLWINGPCKPFVSSRDEGIWMAGWDMSPISEFQNFIYDDAHIGQP